jgi:ASC-1-like (ASCH) protein
MNHLAIMRQPWFSAILSGAKTIESRIGLKRSPPYGKIFKNDWIYWKESLDFVVYCRSKVIDVKYYDSDIVDVLRQFSEKICIDEKFIIEKLDYKYLTLVWIGKVELLTNTHNAQIPAPIPFRQKGQRSWIVDYDTNRTDW